MWARARIVSRLLTRALVAFGAVAVIALAAGIAVALALPPGGTFVDDDGNIHEGNIEAISAAQVTTGCNPPTNNRYCPAATVTRGQMAAFMVRAIGMPGTAIDFFVDDDTSIFENDINKLAAAGITKGCNPPANDRFCPDNRVTRGQMAAFLVRTFDYSDDGGRDWFIDDDGSIFESDIDKVGTAGVTAGCNPPLYDRYCPSDHVTRDQMASFLARALGLDPIVPAPRICPVTGACSLQWPTNLWQASLGAEIPDATRWEVVHVDNTRTGASDGNAGTAGSPLATVQEGLSRAHRAKVKGLNARVLIHPGTYRESLTISAASQSTEQPILRLEAVQPGSVVISGSDVWTGWQTTGSGVWYHHWPYNWGLAPLPSGESRVPEDIVRRREMVFVDGAHAEQVLSYSQLRPGSFFVSESEDRLYLWPVDSGNLNERFVEVAVRHDLLRVNGLSNFVVDGLVFEHASQPFGFPAAQIAGSRNVEVANVTLRWNNWTGFSVWNTSDVTVRNSSAVNNGGGGMLLGRLTSARIEDVATRDNNWRGASGGYTGWSIAGIKAVSVHDVVITGHHSENNAMRGMWLDTYIERVLIDASRWCDNGLNGFYVEATQGPVIVKDTIICNNDQDGLLSSNATDLALLDSTICRNRGAQILISGDPERSFTDPATGKRFSIPPARHWTISGTTIVDSQGNGPLIYTWVGQSFVDEFLSTLSSNHNTWGSARVDRPFWLGGSTTADFGTWQQLTRQDLNSNYTDPGVISGC